MMSVPLATGGKTLGALDLYWSEPRPNEVPVATLVACGRLAAARLHALAERDDACRRLASASELTTVLKQDAHEYANRMQVISALLSLGEEDAARGFLSELLRHHHSGVVADVSQIGNPVVAGTLIAAKRAARQRGVELRFEPETYLRHLPAGVNDVDVVTLLSNLVDNAVDAAAAGFRREVTVGVEEDRAGVVIRVRDWGPGLGRMSVGDAIRPGCTTKDGHCGLGLGLVTDVIDKVGGRLSFDELANGLRVTVELPWTSPDPALISDGLT
jgi:two-component system CitB family sensor kinase